MDGLLPDGVAVVDAYDSAFDRDRLADPPPGHRAAAFAAELRALGNAGPGRRTEFSRARICAHAAVVALGRSPEPIRMGEHREPRWPDGLVGSLTHCAGYRAAAVADTGTVLAIGVDAEPDLPLPEAVSALAFTAADRYCSGDLARFRHWDRLAFSARESVFKAWFTVTGRWLGFADATVSLVPDGPGGGRFAATIASAVPGIEDLLLACGTAVVGGRYRWAAGPTPLVVTAVTLRHRSAGPPAPAVQGGGGEPSSPRVDHR